MYTKKRDKLTALIYLIPVLVFGGVLLLYPILSSILLSFQDVKIPMNTMSFSDLTFSNYGRMFSDPRFYQALLNSFVIVLITVALAVTLGVGTALLINGISALQPLAILPWAIPSVTAAVTFGWIFDGSFGVLNWILVKLGFLSSPIVWNQHPVGAMAMVIFVLLWKGFPFITIMTLAGLQSISSEVFEAARVEGASSWQTLRKVTIPLLMPVITVSGLLTALWVFRDYPIVYLLTGGGPIGKTRTLGLMTYQQAFESFNMSYGATVGVFTLVICFLISTISMKMEDNNE